VTDQERPLTDAEYRAWTERRMRELAAEFSDGLPQEARDAGMRVEWAPGAEPLAQAGVLVYDMVLPPWPRGALWTPLRDILPRASKCYGLASGAMVHVKPGCRC
jgi:hypothetical protein